MRGKNINLEFGQKVKISHKYQRKLKIIRDQDVGYHRSGQYKYWESMSFESSGIFLGTRTLQNGNREYDSDYGYYFDPKEYFKVALICPGPDLNPIYVPLDSIE